MGLSVGLFYIMGFLHVSSTKSRNYFYECFDFFVLAFGFFFLLLAYSFVTALSAFKHFQSKHKRNKKEAKTS